LVDSRLDRNGDSVNAAARILGAVDASSQVRRQLVLVTGSTRSGTSLAAGTLHHLGMHVPTPVLKPNDSNPAGFFESRWPVKFHSRLLEAAVVTATDSRPDAFNLVAGAITPRARHELQAWLSTVFDDATRVVVKDPRSMWVPTLWAEAADSLDARIAFVATLRHPAEVIASRWTYYGSTRPNNDAWRYHIRNLCTWINVNLGTERETRGRPRMIVRYEAMLEDWRRAMRAVRDALSLDLDPALDTDEPHAIDDFIDAALRRHEPSWDGMDLPADLVEIAEAAWDSLGAIADGDPDPATTESRLDDLAARYRRIMRLSQAIAADTMFAYGRTRVQVRVMEIAASGRGVTAIPPVVGGGSGSAGLAGSGPGVAVGPGIPTMRGTRRRVRRAFRRWIKRPLTRTA
jgi:hypothetical protein